MRYLPGRMPVEPARSTNGNCSISAARICPAARETGRHDRGRVSLRFSRHTGVAGEIRWIPAKRRDCDGQQRRAQISTRSQKARRGFAAGRLPSGTFCDRQVVERRRSIFWSTYNEGMRALLLGLFCCALLSASAMPLRDPLVVPGWQHFYNNEYDQALAAFEQEAHEHPKDPAAYNHIAQAVLYRAMFRSGALESQLVTGNNPFLRRAKMNVPPEVKKQFQDALHKAIDLGNAELNR